MSFEAIITAIYDWPVSDAIRQNEFAFPMIECVHVLAISAVVGVISIVDLRLLGVKAHTPAIRTLLGQLIPLVWIAFVVAAISGGLLFASNATGYARNFDFQMKMALMLLAFLNMLAFHLIGRTRLAEWDEAQVTPVSGRISGGLSLLLWVAIVWFGRHIGFSLSPF